MKAKKFGTAQAGVSCRFPAFVSPLAHSPRHGPTAFVSRSIFCSHDVLAGKRPGIHMNLGLGEFKLGRFAEAERSLGGGSQQLPGTKSPGNERLPSRAVRPGRQGP